MKNLKRRFNVTGLCNPNRHYIVDITGKLNQIKDMIDYGDYFTINRARQFGKTTTLAELGKYLLPEYTPLFISFEGWDEKNFLTSENFCQAFLNDIQMAASSKDIRANWLDESVCTFDALKAHITKMCSEHDYVLMIDEVDKTSHNRIFLQFLGVLRAKYLERDRGVGATFQSVILAGVYDIKNIKLKMINDGIYVPKEGENNLRNSPWNIASKFGIDMSFNPDEVSTMLREYEKDNQISMDIGSVSEEIFSYTSGYPFMVSRICQIIHDELDKNWSILGVRTAVSLFLKENNELFKDMSKNLENDKDLYNLLYDVIILKLRRSFSYDNPVIQLAYRYGYIKPSERHAVAVFNRIFETRISDYFITKNELSKPHQRTSVLYHHIVAKDYFDMELCLIKFAEFFNREIFPTKEQKLLEIQYRLSFLSYLKPLLNGIGHYHYESQLADESRMDLVVNYGSQEFIVELKRIFKESDRTDGIAQLLRHMESRGATTGHYLTFDFRKKSESKVEWLEVDGKRILEVSV